MNFTISEVTVPIHPVEKTRHIGLDGHLILLMIMKHAAFLIKSAMGFLFF